MSNGSRDMRTYELEDRLRVLELAAERCWGDLEQLARSMSGRSSTRQTISECVARLRAALEGEVLP